MKIFIYFINFACFLTTLSFADIDIQERNAFIKGCYNAVNTQNMFLVLTQEVELTSELTTIYQNHFNEVVTNKQLLLKTCGDTADIVLADPILLEKLDLESDNRKSFSRTASDIHHQIINRYMTLGLRRMDGAFTIPYFSYLKDSFIDANPFSCKLIMTGAGDLAADSFSIQALVLEQQKKMLSKKVENYLALSRQSMNVAVSDIGEDISFTSTELAAISEEFGNYLFDYSVSFKNAERLANILVGNIQGTNEEYCDLGRLYYGALKTMPGPSGDRVREAYFLKYN